MHMKARHILEGCLAVLRYGLAAGGTFGFLMVLPPAPFLKEADEPFLEALFAAVATAAAFPIVLGAEQLLGGTPAYRWRLHIPLVLWLVLTAAAVALGTLQPFPLEPDEHVAGGMYPPLSGVLNFCFVATLMPPLTFWILLGVMRRVMDRAGLRCGGQDGAPAEAGRGGRGGGRASLRV